MRLIDADALEDVLVNDGFRYCGINEYHDGVANGFLRAIDDVKEAPTIEAEPVRHGKWLENDNGTYSCSECQSWIPKEQQYYARYCLYCGSRMDEVEE